MDSEKTILVQGDFSDLQPGDEVTTELVHGRGNAEGVVRVSVVPGVVVDVTKTGATVLKSHLAKFSMINNRAAITFVRRGGRHSLRAALQEAATKV